METGAKLSISESHTIAAHRQSVERVILSMREHLAEPLSLPEMAKIACLSPFHFDRVFHQTTGIPPVQFLYALRIEAAKRLLLTTSQSVTDVCYEVGYNSIGTFTKRFTQLVGLPPREFRSLAGKLSISLLESWCHRPEDFFSAGACITGQVVTPASFAGVVFLGLFPTAIPQSNPVAGTLLTSAGPYHIGPMPDGKYYVFAAAFPHTRELIAYFLPDASSLLVGAGDRPVIVSNGRSEGPFDMKLRETRVTDPPILISLPFLLATLAGGASSPR